MNKYSILIRKNLITKVFLSAIFLFTLLSPFGGLIANVFADSSGPSNPGTMADDDAVGMDGWNNVDRAKTSDNSYATVYGGVNSTTTYSHYLKATNFGFDIPDGAVINGIRVKIERKTYNGQVGRIVKDEEVKLVKSDGSIGTENKANVTEWSSIDTSIGYGGSTDLWSESWSASDINDADFGVVLSVSLWNPTPFGPASANVDHIEITVYYTLGPSNPGTMADDDAVGMDGWNNVDRAKTSDNSYATVYGGVNSTTTYSHYLKATNFGFDIPDGAVINGIRVKIERKTYNGQVGRIVKDEEVKLVKSDGSIGAKNKARSDEWGFTDTSKVYGSSTDLWSESWSASDINDADFGVVLSVSLWNPTPMGPASANVDHIEITVYYTPLCGDTDGDGITDVVCAPGNIVVGAPDYTYQLTEDLTCTGGGLVIGTDGLVIGADNITIDGNGHTMTGNLSANFGIDNTGGYDGITIKNFGNITNFGGGIHFANSTGGAIQNNTISSNNPAAERFGHGIFLSSSSNNTVANNTVNFNLKGIFLDSSSYNNILTGNTINSNWESGVLLSSSSSGNTLSNNTLFVNLGDGISDNGNNTYSNNQILYPIRNDSNMLTFSEVGRVKGVNDTVSFSVSAFNLNGGACDGCTTITTSPSETVTIDSESGNDITGHFTVTRPGTYSLIVTVTDSNDNVTKKNYVFFVDATGSQTTRYYIRGVNPTHGQFARANDLRSILLTLPTGIELTRCMGWVQNSADEIPYFPLANLSSIDTYTCYLSQCPGSIGIERFVTYGYDMDLSYNVPASPGEYTDPDNYSWIPLDFSNLDWAMEYPWSWYWLTLKLRAMGCGYYGYFSTIWRSTPDEPSYADFIYEYTTTPAVKSISNPDITLLSATEPADDEDSATIVLDGIGSTDIVLDDYNCPFLVYTTTVNSDGTATLQAAGLTGETTINSVKLSTAPSFGSVDINIITWNTGGDYYKEWEETASAQGITAEHIVGDLEPNSYYLVELDGEILNTYLSNSFGQITFTCLADGIFSVSAI